MTWAESVIGGVGGGAWTTGGGGGGGELQAATIAVSAKDVALRYAGEGSTGLWVGHAIEILGAIGITLFGLMFLMASLQGG